MKLSGRLRTIVGVLVGLALIAVGVVATQSSQQSAPAAVALQEHPCSGECATCPHAAADSCPAVETDDAAAETAHVDQDRCIGCVRCVNVAPDAFRINPDTGKAELIDTAPADAIARGARACPVDAIEQ
jgi:ferredoxin